jgi:L-ascorbate metabolism protein UlaG (beta-lactamase superfamily)
MIRIASLFIIAAAGTALLGSSAERPEEDVIKTSSGELRITFVGHASLVFAFGGKIIHVDPFGGNRVRYEDLPKADLILVTHEHFDHMDPEALKIIRRPDTEIVASPACAGSLRGAIILNNGESRVVQGLTIQAVSAYNIVNKRPDGQPFHPKGRGNGYILTFGDKRVYIAGDTEFVPEMRSLGPVDIAFLPMNLPYTMSPEMTAEAARTIHPKILYPYHFGDTKTSRLLELLKDKPEIEIRLRKMS